MEKKGRKEFSPLQFAGRIVIVSCFLFLFAGIVKFGVKNVLIDGGYADSEFMRKVIYILHCDNPGTEMDRERPAPMDWERQYPFASGGQRSGEKKKQNQISEKLSGVEEKINSIEERISYYFEEETFGRKALLEAGAVLENSLQWNISERLKSSPYIFWGGKTGHISRCMGEIDITSVADSLIDFADWVQGQGIPFVYVQFPAKMSGIKNEQLPYGFSDYTDDNADRMLERLADEEVPYLDIRSDIVLQNADTMFESFFRTDHHWLPQAGLKAAGLMAQYLQENGLELDVNILKPENYEITIHEGIYIGSYGRDVTAGLIDPDDFPVITPNFDTFIKIFIPNRSIEKEGDFTETLLNMDKLYPRPSYDLNQYDIYCWGDCPLIRIENGNTGNGNKVLVIKDSYGSVVVPYLALTLGETTLIDLRAFTGSIRGYIEEYEPDYVIVAYNPGMFSETAENASHTSLWDFR